MHVHLFALSFLVIFIGMYMYRSKPLDLSENNLIIKDISVKDAKKMIEENKNNENFIILDIRTEAEFEERNIENSVNLDFYGESFQENLKKLDRTKKYFIYCRSGARSANCMYIMRELEFQEVYNLQKGILAW